MLYLPIKGLSEVIGIISDTVFRNMVRERRIVTPAIRIWVRNMVRERRIVTPAIRIWVRNMVR